MGTPKQLKDKIIAKLFARFPALLRMWAKRATLMRFTDVPWTPLKGSVRESKLALVTTSGVHLKSQPAFDMFDTNGDFTFREIPSNVWMEDLTITHNYYDHSDADKDINIVFPIERVRELKESGDIGDINDRHFSFMGHIRGDHIDSLVSTTAPKVARCLNEDSVDIVILTPA